MLNPASDIPFTQISVWWFIAELLESGYPMQRVVLRKPPGRAAFELKLPDFSRGQDLYIKLMPDGDKVRGRSFHYRDVDTSDE